MGFRALKSVTLMTLMAFVFCCFKGLGFRALSVSWFVLRMLRGLGFVTFWIYRSTPLLFVVDFFLGGDRGLDGSQCFCEGC